MEYNQRDEVLGGREIEEPGTTIDTPLIRQYLHRLLRAVEAKCLCAQCRTARLIMQEIAKVTGEDYGRPA